jgi:predicted glutamine amidotransferase
MCRWMIYSGGPLLVSDLLFRPAHSLIDQSLHARMGATTTNGDGFGIGWYGEGARPAVFKAVDPAWSDANLRELAGQLRTSLLFAHVRASTGTAVQRTNCHPFRHDRWLWMHNGMVRGFELFRRDLVLRIDPEFFAELEGTTDSEVLFLLALSMGLEDDPVTAVARTVGLVEAVAAAHDVPEPLQMTVATTDGESVWTFRYSSEGRSRTLFHSADVATLRALHPEVAELGLLGDEARFVVSEPLGDLPGAWQELPESSVAVVRPGLDEVRDFTPVPP